MSPHKRSHSIKPTLTLSIPLYPQLPPPLPLPYRSSTSPTKPSPLRKHINISPFTPYPDCDDTVRPTKRVCLTPSPDRPEYIPAMKAGGDVLGADETTMWDVVVWVYIVVSRIIFGLLLGGIFFLAVCAWQQSGRKLAWRVRWEDGVAGL